VIAAEVGEPALLLCDDSLRLAGLDPTGVEGPVVGRGGVVDEVRVLPLDDIPCVHLDRLGCELEIGDGDLVDV